MLNLTFDGVLVATLQQDKARKLATAILLALDTADSDPKRFNHTDICAAGVTDSNCLCK